MKEQEQFEALNAKLSQLQAEVASNKAEISKLKEKSLKSSFYLLDDYARKRDKAFDDILSGFTAGEYEGLFEYEGFRLVCSAVKGQSYSIIRKVLSLATTAQKVEVIAGPKEEEDDNWSEDSTTPLVQAVQTGDINIVRYVLDSLTPEERVALIKNFSEIQIKRYSDAIEAAITADNVEIVTYMLEWLNQDIRGSIVEGILCWQRCSSLNMLKVLCAYADDANLREIVDDQQEFDYSIELDVVLKNYFKPGSSLRKDAEIIRQLINKGVTKQHLELLELYKQGATSKEIPKNISFYARECLKKGWLDDISEQEAGKSRKRKAESSEAGQEAETEGVSSNPQPLVQASYTGSFSFAQLAAARSRGSRGTAVKREQEREHKRAGKRTVKKSKSVTQVEQPGAVTGSADHTMSSSSSSSSNSGGWIENIVNQRRAAASKSQSRSS